MAPANKLHIVFLCLLLITGFTWIVNCKSVGQQQQYYPTLCDVSGESSEECETDIEEPLYLLYTDPKNPDDYKQIFLNENDTARITAANPHKNSVWKVLIHGFLNNANSTFPTNVRKAYMERSNKTGINYNVLVVDWGRGACASFDSAKSYFYDYAAKNVAKVGKRVGEFIVFLHDNNILDLTTDVHLIGFSLGAHVAGQAGRRVYDRTGKTVRRITALDPAGPAFWAWKFVTDFMLPKRRLHRKDTQFADIYHTSELFGSDKKMGDVDFIINGGKSQPSCVPKLFSYLPFAKDFVQVCSHTYSTELYAKTINDNSMKGCMCPSRLTYQLGNCKCKDYAVFGEFTDNSTITVGSFFIDTPQDDVSFMGSWLNFSFKDLKKKWWDMLCHD